MNTIPSIKKSVDILRKHKVPYALLHVTSLYPTPYEKVRLGALSEMKSIFPDAVFGLSDHSLGNYTCFASVALSASILEKHFTSDKNWPGPDISLSINPNELKEDQEFVDALGDILMNVLEEEIKADESFLKETIKNEDS